MARSAPPPAPLTFVYISAAAFLLALIAAGLFIAFADRLAFIPNSVYFIVLLPLALAAAAFLFGTLRSHARYRGSVASGTLELGGPVVVFALVMLGGLLIANPAETGTVTIRLFDADAPAERIDEGEVELWIGDDLRSRSVGPGGQVTFTQVPVSFLTGDVRVIARVDRYRMQSAGPYRVSPQGLIEVPLERVPERTEVAGTISHGNRPVQNALVSFAHGRVTAHTDANGNFRVTVPFAEGATIPVTVTVAGRTVHDDRYVVSSEAGLRVSVTEGEG